jgi:hypothetical protein
MDASLIITSMIDAMSTVDIDAREKTGFIDQSSLAYAWLRVRQYDSLTVPETNRGHPPIPDGIEHACITYTEVRLIAELKLIRKSLQKILLDHLGAVIDHPE